MEKNKEEEFNCVKLMRNIRNEIHNKYKNNPELRKIELERIRKQRNIYNQKIKNSNWIYIFYFLCYILYNWKIQLNLLCNTKIIKLNNWENKIFERKNYLNIVK